MEGRVLYLRNQSIQFPLWILASIFSETIISELGKESRWNNTFERSLKNIYLWIFHEKCKTQGWRCRAPAINNQTHSGPQCTAAWWVSISQLIWWMNRIIRLYDLKIWEKVHRRFPSSKVIPWTLKSVSVLNIESVNVNNRDANRKSNHLQKIHKNHNP